ncbi:MAG TPA: alpha/beta hydrolase [Ruminococcaceae bacterium]|nr:alpha/beta hydrolase [Oscillospiraceae bacterium]
MEKSYLKIKDIYAVLWGAKSDKLYIYVHGKKGNKEDAELFAEKAAAKGFQVLSFDIPGHGDRTEEQYPYVPWNGARDLDIIGEYARSGWDEVSLCAVSIGAYFSLLAYGEVFLRKCLFLSPILNMELLIQNMMKWFNVDEETLREKQEIPTPMDETLSWDYYRYVRENPITKWNVPTAILYGSQDGLTERKTAEGFAERFSCKLTVLEGGGHWFQTKRELTFLSRWLDEQI